ncbi:MAG TPA: protein kinase [Polyangiales bacterium]|nr:protein kinase [Polyangiales bacterium]
MSGLVVTPSLVVGRTVDDRYRLEERLGTGTYGVTYRARHIEHQRIVALKLMHEHLASNAAYRASFESEAMRLARVAHPSIVTLVKYGEHAGQPWVAYEWLEGETLATHIERGAVPIVTALAIVRQLLAALASAHAARLVHRNVKPTNVILERRTAQGRERVKLVDFAPALPALAPPTLANMVSAYSPPEFVAGEELDARSDVFGVGATLIGMLNGSERDGQDNTATMPRGLTGVHARALPGVDASLVTWIRRATSVHRAMRFADAADALRELIDLLPRDVRSPSALSEATSGARALVESRGAARPTTRPVAPLPVLPSMSRSEIPPPPSRTPARVEVPKVAPAPSLPSVHGEARSSVATAAPAPVEEPARVELEPPPIDVEPLIALSARAESARGTLRPIEKRITVAITTPRALPLMAAGVFAFLIVALGVFLHGRGREPTKPVRAAAGEATEDSAPMRQERVEAEAPKPEPQMPVAAKAAPVSVAPAPPAPATNVPKPTAVPALAPVPAPIVMPAEPVAAPAAPAPAPAPRPSTTTIVAAPGRPPVRDPWQESAPQMLKRWHELALNGAPGGEGTVKAIREYNRDHLNDVRGNLVIGQLYCNRFWRTDCVEEFGTALERDPTVRGAPEVLPALLDMVAQGKVPALAQRLIIKVYGSEALDPIDQAFGEIRNPEYAARLHALRLKLMEGSQPR